MSTGRNASPDAYHPLLQRAHALALEYLASLSKRAVGAQQHAGQLIDRLGGELPFEPTDPLAVVEDLAREADPGPAANAGPTCWLGGTTWNGEPAMRISVSGWSTTGADIDRSADAILRC